MRFLCLCYAAKNYIMRSPENIQRSSESILVPVSSFLQNGEKFSYGRATAELLVGEEKLNKSSRMMIRRTKLIFDALGLSSTEDRLANNAIFHDNGNSFAELQVGGKKFFVMARDPIESNSLTNLVNKNLRLSMVSGPCLFNIDTARGLSRDGIASSIANPQSPISNRIDKLEIDGRLSIYEQEAIVRLSTFLNALIQKLANIDVLYLSIPKVEYYLYILDGYKSGMASSEIVLNWFNHVDLRHNRMFEQMKKRSIRGLSLKRDIKVVDHCPLDPIREYIVNYVRAAQVPNLDEAKNILIKGSSLWKNLMAADDPMSWYELNNLSYVFAELNAGIDSLAVVVESPTESKIFAHAKRLVPEIKRRSNVEFNVIALYPHELLIPSGENSSKTMYHVSTTGVAYSKLAVAKAIFRAYR